MQTRRGSFSWEDPFLLNDQLEDDERMIRDRRHQQRAQRAPLRDRREAGSFDPDALEGSGATGREVDDGVEAALDDALGLTEEEGVEAGDGAFDETEVEA